MPIESAVKGEVLSRLKALVLDMPEVQNWPELANLYEMAVDNPRHDWEWPLLACQAVGGDPSAVIPGMAAIGCMYLSIILVDDMLDADPRGAHLRYGDGPAANMAVALASIAVHVIGMAPVEADVRAAVMNSLAHMSLATAYGQYLDIQNLSDEENYWRVAHAKSTPFYGAGLHVGALMGKAAPEIAGQLRDFGILNGEIIQIKDDLIDALQKPANPDWKQGRNNLPILYALTADHPERGRFIELLPQIEDAAALDAAQQILIHSGAVSYCAYHLLLRQQEARKKLDAIPLVNSAPMEKLLEIQVAPLKDLFERIGVDIPIELD
ncbi:MAG: polyprenyl synthetase family protein [Chloroflexi bacterium]|nr:polyprenyl synthetase family protein [Chloroflexota bacterium]